MKRIMILVFALPLALAIAGAAMTGVTLATVGDGSDAAPQGGVGIGEPATVTTERITVGVNSCWMQSSSWTRGAAAESGESDSATGAQPLVETYIRICNFEDDVSVTTVTAAGERERSLIGENDCWSQTSQLRLGLIAPYSVIGRVTGAEMPGGWWNAQMSESIRFCNFAGDITVITENWPSQQWVPNVVPADAIAA